VKSNLSYLKEKSESVNETVGSLESWTSIVIHNYFQKIGVGECVRESERGGEEEKKRKKENVRINKNSFCRNKGVRMDK